MSSSSGGREPGERLGFELTPNTMTIRYRANSPGILTVTDSWDEGWRASVNGRETPVLRVNGVFRGVRIDAPGVYEIVFWYRPPWWRLTLGLAAAGGLLLLVSQWTALRFR